MAQIQRPHLSLVDGALSGVRTDCYPRAPPSAITHSGRKTTTNPQHDCCVHQVHNTSRQNNVVDLMDHRARCFRPPQQLPRIPSSPPARSAPSSLRALWWWNISSIRTSQKAISAQRRKYLEFNWAKQSRPWRENRTHFKVNTSTLRINETFCLWATSTTTVRELLLMMMTMMMTVVHS